MGNDGGYQAEVPTRRMRYLDLETGAVADPLSDTMHVRDFLSDLCNGRISLYELSVKDLRIIGKYRSRYGY